MWNRVMCDSIVLFIVLSLCFAAFYVAVYEARKYRAKIKESQKKISDSLIIRILSLAIVVIILSALYIPIYFTTKCGITAMNMKDILLLHYSDMDLINILDLVYKISGMFLITMSFILGFIYLVILGFAISYFLVKPEVDDMNTYETEEETDCKIEDEEIEKEDDTDEDGYKLI